VGNVEPIRPVAPSPPGLQQHALENLQYIRATMERAGSFTAVPGLGGVFMGVTALGAAYVAARQPAPTSWLNVWMTELAVAFCIGTLSMFQKSRRCGVPLWTEAGRKFVLGFAPPLLAGALLTAPLFAAGHLNVVAAVWLMLYGVAVVAGGAYSVRSVPAMGAGFFALGVIALFTPASLRDLWLAAGFGGLHIGFGTWILRKHGG
jgi:hypothetical protein